MTLRWADRVADTSTTPGTGNITTAGSPPTGFQGFASIASITTSDTFYYGMADQSTADWEVGLGTVVSVSPFIFSRAPSASSNSGSAVSFSAGTRNVWLDLPASVVATIGTGGSPGGSSGQVQFNSGGSSFGGAAALTYSASGTNLTVTAQNTTDIPLVVKAIASQSGDLQEWQNSSGVALAKITSSGGLLVPQSGGFNFIGDTSTGFNRVANQQIAITLGGTNMCVCLANNFRMGSGGSYGWTSTQSDPNNGGTDTFIYCDSANIVAQRNAANSNAFRVYNTWSGAGANYERLELGFKATSNVARLSMSYGGTGTSVRVIAIDAYPKGSAPAASDLPAGTFGCIWDGTNAWMCYNNGGTLQKVQLT